MEDYSVGDVIRVNGMLRQICAGPGNIMSLIPVRQCGMIGCRNYVMLDNPLKQIGAGTNVQVCGECVSRV